MTERLYYHDSYLTNFRARVVDTAPGGKVWLDRTAFYPTSGGQPFDTGLLGGLRVLEVADDEERVLHIVDGEPGPGEVECTIDWTRRFDHMQQHTGQHLLSAVLFELFQFPTVSFHLGRDSSTIDVTAARLDPQQVVRAEHRVNEIVFENRPVEIAFLDASEATGLRKASEREGELRIVSIQGLDKSACGGTHVRRTGEIGPILIRKLEKMRGNVRIEFLCGDRAVDRARADYDSLARVAQVFSAGLDEVPALVAAQQARVVEADKTTRRLSTELAGLRGKEWFGGTAADAAGTRRAVKWMDGALDDVVRAEAQGFVAGGQAIVIFATRNPASLLVAASADAGVNAGAVLKQALTAVGGRGGGSAQMAQGSVPDASQLDAVLPAVKAALGF